MQNNYPNGEPVYNGDPQEINNGFQQADGTGAYPPQMPAGQNMPGGAPVPGYTVRAVPVRRVPARHRPELTNGYMFSFGNQQEDQLNEMNERQQLEMLAQRIRMNMQAEQAQSAQQTGQAQQMQQEQYQQYLQYQQAQQQYQQALQYQLAQQHQQQLAAQQAAAQSSSAARQQENLPARPLSRAKLLRDSIMLVGMLAIFAFSSVFMLTSGIRQSSVPTEQKSFFEDLNTEILAFQSDSVSSIFEIPKVYLLPWGEQPAPVPDPDGFGETTDENGTKVRTYKDPTISVSYWTERHYDSTVHFAEIKVAHPTQLRTAYAGGEFGSSVKYMPQEIARQVNAVIAVNADYCGYRTGGIIVRQNTIFRDTPRGWDILLIDSNGDFHIMEDKDVYPSGIMEEYEIVNTLEFGPSLIVDGEVKLLNLKSGCGPTWSEKNPSPRTAVGQIDRLHYLFCCVEGRSESSRGMLTSELARVMLKKGCTQAYNLDGGQSTTMVLNGKAMNRPLWGSQRVVTDIIYCATAIPNEEGEAVNE